MGKQEKLYNAMSEQELVEAMRQGNERVIDFVYKKHYTMIKSLVLQINVRLVPEDIYQESFMVLLSKLYDGDIRCKISTYLYSVARNKSLKGLRTIAHTSENDHEFIEIDDDLAEFGNQEEKFKLMHEALNHLGDKCKALLTYFYGYDWRMDEIAEKLNYTNSANAKNQKYKCMKKLKGLLNG